MAALNAVREMREAAPETAGAGNSTFAEAAHQRVRSRRVVDVCPHTYAEQWFAYVRTWAREVSTLYFRDHIGTEGSRRRIGRHHPAR